MTSPVKISNSNIPTVAELPTQRLTCSISETYLETSRQSGSPKWMAASLSLLAARALSIVLPMITFPIIVRALGPDDYGKWSFAQALIAFFAMAANPGLTQYGGRELAAHPEQSELLIAKIRSLQSVLSIAMLFVLSLYSYYGIDNYETRLVVLLLGATIFANSLFGFDWVFGGLRRFREQALIQAVSQIVFALGIISLVSTMQSLWLMPVLTVSGTVISGLFGLAFLKRLNVRYRLVFCMQSWRSIIGVSGFYALAAGMSLIYQRADFMLLDYFHDVRIVGLYSAPYRITEILMSVVLIGTTIIVPNAAYIATNHPEALRPMMRNNIMGLLALSLPIAAGVSYLADDIVRLVLTEQYAESGANLRSLALILPFGVAAALFSGTLLYARGHYKAYALAITLAAIVNMTANFALIPFYAGLGAAWATLAAQGTVAAFSCLIRRDEIVGFFSPALLLPPIAVVAMLLMLRFANDVGLNLWIRIIGGGITYLAMLLFMDALFGSNYRKILQGSFATSESRN